MSEVVVQEDLNENEDDRISRLVEELRWEPTEDEIRELHEERMREIAAERRATVVYDAGSSKRMSLSTFEHFYGTDEFSDELFEAANRREQYSKETATKIKRLYNQKAVRHEDVKLKRERLKEPEQPAKAKSKQEQFLKVPYRFLKKVKGSGCHRNPTTLLMTLMQHRAWPGKRDKHLTYTYWYRKKGKIVASRSIEQLTQDMGVSEKSIRRFLNALANNGDIKKMKGDGKGYKRDNIYILGEVDDQGNEILYSSRK